MNMMQEILNLNANHEHTVELLFDIQMKALVSNNTTILNPTVEKVVKYMGVETDTPIREVIQYDWEYWDKLRQYDLIINILHDFLLVREREYSLLTYSFKDAYERVTQNWVNRVEYLATFIDEHIPLYIEWGDVFVLHPKGQYFKTPEGLYQELKKLPRHSEPVREQVKIIKGMEVRL